MALLPCHEQLTLDALGVKDSFFYLFKAVIFLYFFVRAVAKLLVCHWKSQEGIKNLVSSGRINLTLQTLFIVMTTGENSEKSKQERIKDAHNKSIVGKGAEWYETSYEDCIEQMIQREARSKELVQEDTDDEDSKRDHDDEDEDDDDDDDYDLDFSVLREYGANSSTQPHVNGTESSIMSDEDMFED